MADKEINDLTAAGALSGDELVHIVQSGNSRKTTLTDVIALVDPGDVLPSYGSGDAGKVLKVNVTEDGLEWDMDDVGSSLPTPTGGDAGKVVTVNGTEDGYVLETPSAGSDELPAYTSGEALYVLRVNSAGDGVEWVRPGTLRSIRTQTVTAFDFGFADIGALVRTTNAAAVSATVLPDATTNMPIGSTINITQDGTGQVEIVEGSGVTINTPETLFLRKRYSVASLMKTAADTWLLTGDLELL